MRARFATLPFGLLVMLGALGLLVGSNRAGAQASTAVRTARSVLVLYSDSRLLTTNTVFDASLRQTLRSYVGEPVDCFSEFLDEVHFPALHQERMRDFLRAKYADRPPDAIIAFAPASLDFCLRFRSELFPDAPIIFAGVGAHNYAGVELEPRVTGVRSSFDPSATLRLALRLHPDTQHVFVVDEPSRADLTSGWEGLRESESRPRFHHLDARPLPQLLETLSQLPDESLVLYLGTLASEAGRRVTPQEIAQRMAAVSRAPIYATFDAFVGHGVVAAVTTPMDASGRETAELVVQVLRRERVDPLPPVQTQAAAPIFDWQQLQRWNVRENQLPTGSIVLFKPRSFWQQHLRLVFALTGLFLLQSGLILALVLQSVRRRRAEREALRRRQELAHTTRVATMGELTASLAHEINQPLAAILSNTQAAQRLLAAGNTNGDEIREILADIVADDQRAGEVIRRMRALLRKGESEPTVLDVNDLAVEVVGLVRGELILQNVAQVLDLSPTPLRVHGDRVQLQQALLNLVINALDAMKDTPNGDRKLRVRTAAIEGRLVRVSVEDTGVGLPADSIDRVFERFVTTKPHGMGLGLAICSSIIQAHGGRVGAANNAGRGATFWFNLPAVYAEAKR
jgi:signal transduction histidine kinase